MIWTDPPAAKIGYEAWNAAFGRVPETFPGPDGAPEPRPDYLATPRCFVELAGDSRLRSLKFDNSLAALRLWSFLLSENDRLSAARRAGRKIVGVLKDLGTAPLLAYAAPGAVAFYPDGAWWIPCVMEMSEGLLRIADAAGFGDEVCPVRAALAAFLNRAHFPIPDLLVAAVGACCDDMSCLMQRLDDLDVPLVWWEVPYRRGPAGPKAVAFVAGQLDRVRRAISDLVGRPITDDMLAEVIVKANRIRARLRRIRDLAYGVVPAPFPALETQIVEMLALHFCSDIEECGRVLEHIVATLERRTAAGEGVLAPDACRVVWINPVADLRVMTLFEDMGGLWPARNIYSGTPSSPFPRTVRRSSPWPKRRSATP